MAFAARSWIVCSIMFLWNHESIIEKRYWDFDSNRSSSMTSRAMICKVHYGKFSSTVYEDQENSARINSRWTLLVCEIEVYVGAHDDFAMFFRIIEPI